MHAGHYHMNVTGSHAGGKDLIKVEFLHSENANIELVWQLLHHTH
jgi:hypothetical protein